APGIPNKNASTPTSRTISVPIPPLPQADLAVTEVNIVPIRSPLRIGWPGIDQVQVFATVKNVGDAASGPFSFNCSIQDNGPGAGGGNNPGLKPNPSRVIPLTLDASSLAQANAFPPIHAHVEITPPAPDRVSTNNSGDSRTIYLPPLPPAPPPL